MAGYKKIGKHKKTNTCPIKLPVIEAPYAQLFMSRIYPVSQRKTFSIVACAITLKLVYTLGALVTEMSVKIRCRFVLPRAENLSENKSGAVQKHFL